MRWLLSISLLLFSSLTVHAQSFEPEIYKARRETVLDHLGEAIAVVPGYSGALGMGVYRQSTHLIYLAGVETPNAYLVLDGRSRRTLLFLPEPTQFLRPQFPTEDKEALLEAPWNRPPGRLSPGGQAVASTGIEDVYSLASFWDEVEPLARQASRIFVDYDDRTIWAPSPLGPLRTPGRQVADRLQDLLPTKQLENLAPMLRKMRLVKDQAEIETLRRGVEITCNGINEVIRTVRPGMTELEVAGLLDYEWKKQGGQRVAFDSIIHSGPTSMLYFTMPWETYNAYSRRIEQSDLVFIDVGTEYNFYGTDVCRTVPASGRFDPIQRKYYEIVLEASNAALARIRPGAMMEDVVRASAEVFKKHGLDEYENIDTMGIDKIWGPMPSPTHYVNRAKGLVARVRDLGHHVGLRAVEGRDYGEPMQVGWVFTIEPKLFVTDQSFGIMIEDQVLVTEDGMENLSRSSPRTVEEIEALMARGRSTDSGRR